MTIAIFLEFWRPWTSGVVTSCEILARQLQKRGHRVIFFAPHWWRYKDSDEFEVVRLFSLPFPLSATKLVWIAFPFLFPFIRRRLIRKVHSLNLDIIHIQGPYPTGFLGLALGRKLGIPVVMTYHTHIQQYLRVWSCIYLLLLVLIFRILAWWSIRFVSKRVAAIFAPSQFIKIVLRKNGVRKKILVLPTAVITPQNQDTKEKLRQKLGLPLSNPLLLFVGRISSEKNIQMLIRAIDRIHQKHPEVILILVGDGPQRKEIEKMVSASGFSENVIFVGEIPHAKVWQYLYAADIFVFPSITEVQGLSVSEALAAGLPCVITEVGGVAEFVTCGKDALVTQANSKEFAEAIIHLIEHPKYAQKMGQEALRNSRQFDPDIIYPKMIEYYQETRTRFIDAHR